MAVEAQYSFNPTYYIKDQQINTLVSRKRMRDDDQFQQIPSKIQVIPYYHQQNRPHVTEIDALIHLHNAEVKSELAEIQKRHCAEFLRVCENHATNKINEKDAEIEKLKRKQIELEASLKQAVVENQTWFNVAKNSESLVASLKSNLDQVLRRGFSAGGECHVASVQAEDAESCCYEGDSDDRQKGRRLCKLCGERNVSVLVLPCRHLCFCMECEAVSDTCPICYGVKNVGLQVFME